MIFYDTNALLLKADDLFTEPYFVISSITLNELENIKTSNTKEPEIKFSARKILHLLDENPDKYIVHVFKLNMLGIFTQANLDITNDIKILATAYDYMENYDSQLTFITNDLALKNIAKMFFEKVESIDEKNIDDYTGYLEITMDDAAMADFYLNPHSNTLDLKINQYVNIYDTSGKLVDTLVWTGEEYRRLEYGTFKSKWFGEIKSKRGDIYQALAVDSLINNQITLIKGPAGAGKTIISLGYLFSLLDCGKIDKIIVFCNTVATKDSAKLGFYPGTRDQKLLDSQLGNLLTSKIGSQYEVERLISEEKLVLLPLSDLRGYDTSGMNAGIYISEAQNMSIELMKLALQRIGEDSICIIDGDDNAQVDSNAFSGNNNGMRRASKIFRGEDIYGEVALKNIHRSKIAKIAEKL